MYLLSIAAVIAVAVVIAGVCFRLIEASIWLALTVIGQAAILLLIDAGSTLHYQHFRQLHDLWLNGGQVPLGLLFVQTLLVAARLSTKRSELHVIASSAGTVFRPVRWALLGFFLFATSATISREPKLYIEELLLATLSQLLILGTVLLFALSLRTDFLKSAKVRLNALLGETDVSQRPGLDRFFICGGLFVTALSSILAIVVYQRHPHIPDEVSYLLHARYFAQGMLTMRPAPVPPAFDLDLMMQEANRWYSPFPPGWPAILAFGVFAGIPWLVNPLLAGINIILSGVFVSRMYGTRTARMACLLLCVSPWYVFMAMNLMSHTASMTCLLIAALAVQRMRNAGSLWWSFPGGFALGLLSLIRPLEGVIIALALGLWSLGGPVRKFKLAPGVTLAVVTALIASLQLAYNSAVVGSATTFPVNRYFDVMYGPGVNDLGFGPNRGIGWAFDPFPGHGWRDVLVNTNLNLTAINTELFGWGIGSLLLMAVVLLSQKKDKRVFDLVFLIVFVIGIQSLYWFSGGPDFGARYWYPIILPVVILSIRGLEWLAMRADSLTEDGTAGTRIVLAISGLILAAVVTFFPWRAMDKYYHYRGMRPDIRSLSESVPFGRSVVFIRGARHPDYASAAVYNPINLNVGAPVYVWDRSREVREDVLKAYPDRTVWFVDGPTVTGKGFQVVGGPLKATDAVQFTAALRNMSQTHQ